MVQSQYTLTQPCLPPLPPPLFSLSLSPSPPLSLSLPPSLSLPLSPLECWCPRLMATLGRVCMSFLPK